MDKNLQKYINDNYSKLQSYIDNIQNGNIISGKYEKLAVQRFLKLKSKYIYKEEVVKKVIKFFYLLNINIDNKYKKFDFLDFQVFWLANLYGIHKTKTERLFKRAYITIGKKNGKTLFNSCLALYECIYDEELDANIVLLASNREQANISLNFIKSVIENSPLLPPLTVQRNQIIYKYKNTINRIQVKSSDSKGIQGGSYSFSLIDEYSFHKNDELANRSYSASAARFNPLQMIVTTAGYDVNIAPSFDVHQTSMNILDGIVEDDSLFTCIYTLDNIEEVHNANNWRKSNPALNKTVKIEFIQALYNQAMTMQSFKTTFMTDNMNVWFENLEEIWISDEKIKEQMMHDYIIPSGSSVQIGADLSATKDLTSITVLYYDEKNDRFLAEFYNLFPLNGQTKKGGNVDFKVWIDEGYITQTEESAIADNDVIELIKKINEKYKIISIGIDRHIADKIKVRIENDLGIDVHKVAINMVHMSVPTKEIEKNILLKKLYLQKNPLIRYCFKNVDIYVDGTGNLKMNKKKNKPIDPIIALGVAFYEFLSYNYNYAVYDSYNNYLNQN